MRIVEAITRDRVLTTGQDYIHERMQTPMPGDIILFRNMGPDKYPFTHVRGYCGDTQEQALARRGTVEYVRDGKVAMCCEEGSCHLCIYEEPNGKARVGLSISGGPFTSVKLSRLKPTGQTQPKQFWSWCEHGSGADQGMYYTIDRPVFELMPEEA